MQRLAAAHRRTAALELVEGDVHAGPGEGVQRSFEAVRADQARHVAEGAARDGEQPAVRAARVCVHGVLELGEEAGVALGDAARDGTDGFVDADPPVA